MGNTRRMSDQLLSKMSDKEISSLMKDIELMSYTRNKLSTISILQEIIKRPNTIEPKLLHVQDLLVKKFEAKYNK